ncbi:MAG: hypothetical protein JRH15_02870 [Deltaproteobacteria bacterium]|nr:hypothetical protein [Deltaproteobacteria bacterium]
MANLQIKGVDDDLYKELKALAARENRSVSQQVLYFLKFFISRKKTLQSTKSAGEVLLELSGSWQDARESEDIIADIRAARKNSKKLKKGF